MKLKIISSIAALGFASASYAGSPDPIVPATTAISPPVAAATTWDGFYVGALAGFTSGSATYANPNFGPVSFTNDQNYGGFVGYNIQRNKLVFGGELAYVIPVDGLSPVGFPAEDHTYMMDLKGRVGFSLNKVLVYGFAGYSLSGYDNVIDDVKTLSGFNYGVGADMMLGSHMFVGAEYIVRSMTGGGNTSQVGQTRTSDVQEAQVRIGWKF